MAGSATAVKRQLRSYPTPSVGHRPMLEQLGSTLLAFGLLHAPRNPIALRCTATAAAAAGKTTCAGVFCRPTTVPALTGFTLPIWRVMVARSRGLKRVGGAAMQHGCRGRRLTSKCSSSKMLALCAAHCHQTHPQADAADGSLLMAKSPSGWGARGGTLNICRLHSLLVSFLRVVLSTLS